MLKFTRFYNFLVFALAICSISIFSGCKGPEGPAGTAGTNGKDGINGKDGLAGVEPCKQCHGYDTTGSTTRNVVDRYWQWQHSTHASSTNSDRNSTSCAPCHTMQGYREVVLTHADTTVATVVNSIGQNCATCHYQHQNMDYVKDFALTNSEPVKLLLQVGATRTTFDFGRANLCARCHQGRPVNPYPDAAKTDSITITNNRFGPHHDPAANVIAGMGAFAFSPGDYSEVTPTTHRTGSVCITCHMATAIGPYAGGHTFNPSYNGTPNTAGCVTSGCHAKAPSAAATITLNKTRGLALRAELARDRKSVV